MPRPAHIQQLLDSAIQHHKNGQLKKAVSHYETILKAQPEDAKTCYLLGVLRLQQNHFKDAIRLIKIATREKPGISSNHYSLAAAFHGNSQLDDAVASLLKAVELKPAYFDAQYFLGIIYQKRHRLKEAIQAYTRALEIKPDDTLTHYNLGTAYEELKQTEFARTHYQKSLDLSPRSALAMFGMANILRSENRWQEAEKMYVKGLEIDPGNCLAHLNRGVNLHERGNPADAIAAYDEALKIDSKHPLVHLNRGHSLLLLGHYKDGFHELEWGSKLLPVDKNDFQVSSWNGEDFTSGTLAVTADQGLGDAILNARFLPLAKKHGGTIVLVCHAGLVKLMDGVEGIDQVMEKNTDMAEDFLRTSVDYRVSLESLARILDIHIGNLPSPGTYLYADPGLSSTWRSRIDCNTYNVGIAWGGNHRQLRDANRSCPLEEMLFLIETPGTRFYSLQLRQALDHLKNTKAKHSIIDLSCYLTDMAETAAAIDNLDLVITIDTSVAHLAGALGKEVWVMVSHCPHWIYALNGSSTSWYPSMRIFRQKAPGDWKPVLDEVRDELVKIVRQ